MKQIVFYEDKNFQGRSHACKSDTSDLHSFFSRCNSIRVEGGCWVVYERPNFMGYQYVLTPGEYADYQHWLGFSDCIRSCRVVKIVHGSDQIKLFEKPNFEGTVMEVTENIPSTLDYFSNRAVHSCRVLDGAWVFFEHPNYRGRQYLLEKGDYSCYTEWGAMYPTVGSIRHITSY